MEENMEECPLNDSKRNQKLPHVFPSDSCKRFQSIKEDDGIYAMPKEQDYLNERNIFDLFHFLLSHLIVRQPTNPIQYLYQLLDDLILFRSGLKDPRLFWKEKHVLAMFNNVVPYGSELLSLDSYKTAMKCLGVRSYDPCPFQLVPGYIDRRTFCTEAFNNMKRELTRIANGIF